MSPQRRDSPRSNSPRPRPRARVRTPFEDATWERVAWSYLVSAGVVGLLVAASAPLLATVLVAGVAVTAVGLRRARSTWRPLVRCARTCRTIHLSVGDRLLVTVTRPHLEPCCDDPAG